MARTTLKHWYVNGFGEYLKKSDHGSPNQYAPNKSQGYITKVATKAVIFIEADNPYIGLMCFLALSMTKVSTCEITTEGEEGSRNRNVPF